MKGDGLSVYMIEESVLAYTDQLFLVHKGH